MLNSVLTISLRGQAPPQLLWRKLKNRVELILGFDINQEAHSLVECLEAMWGKESWGYWLGVWADLEVR